MKRFKSPTGNLPAGRFFCWWDTLVNSEKRNFLQVIFLQILFFLSLLYEGIIRLIRAGSGRRKRLNGRVISVGNLTLGGTGKTPLVEYLARWLRRENRKVAVLSRGYGRSTNQEWCIHNDALPHFSLVGDEPLMFKRKNRDIPVLVGKDRYSIGKKAESKLEIDTFILDDGFQHWRLARDLEIVVLDAVSPFGNGYLLPRGNLRVPADFLRFADIVVLTRVEQGKERLQELKEELFRINPGLLVADAAYQPKSLRYSGSERVVPLAELTEEPVGLICGIGNPKSFRSTVEGLNAKVVSEFFFIDHYPYQKRDILEALSVCREENLKFLITTEKDEVRFPDTRELEGIHEVPLLVLEVSLRLLHGEEELRERVRRILRKND